MNINDQLAALIATLIFFGSSFILLTLIARHEERKYGDEDIVPRHRKDRYQ